MQDNFSDKKSRKIATKWQNFKKVRFELRFSDAIWINKNFVFLKGRGEIRKQLYYWSKKCWETYNFVIVFTFRPHSSSYCVVVQSLWRWCWTNWRVRSHRTKRTQWCDRGDCTRDTSPCCRDNCPPNNWLMSTGTTSTPSLDPPTSPTTTGSRNSEWNCSKDRWMI